MAEGMAWGRPLAGQADTAAHMLAGSGIILWQCKTSNDSKTYYSILEKQPHWQHGGWEGNRHVLPQIRDELG